MKITASEAEAFFAPQRRGETEPLPDWMAYYVNDDVCLATHWTHVPGLLLCHVGVFPSAWGKVKDKGMPLLMEAWAEHAPERMGAWVNQSNRAACALARRCGFVEDGRLPMDDPVILYGWRP